MSRIRDLRRLVNRLRSGPIPPDAHTLEVLEKATAGLQVNLLWTFSIGKEGIPPKERVRRANALCKAARIILSARDQVILQSLNGALDALEKAVERTEERREAFLNLHPGLKRRTQRRSVP